MKVKEIIKLIEEDGWVFVSQSGSHRKFRHPTKDGHVIVPGKPSSDLKEGTQKAILKQAQLK